MRPQQVQEILRNSAPTPTPTQEGWFAVCGNAGFIFLFFFILMGSLASEGRTEASWAQT
jgi:hypothetical protein